MSSEDQLRPYHAKKASGQEAADAVAAVLQHAAARDVAQHKKIEQKKQPKWMLPLGINLGVFAVYLLIAPPAWVVVNPLEGPPIEEQRDKVKLAMYFQANQVAQYLLQQGQLPLSLEDATGRPSSLVEYSVQGPTYFRLTTVPSLGDPPIVYDSTQPLNEWIDAGATGKLLGGG